MSTSMQFAEWEPTHFPHSASETGESWSLYTSKRAPVLSLFGFPRSAGDDWRNNMLLGYFQKTLSAAREGEMQSVINGHKFHHRAESGCHVCADAVK